MLRLGSRYPVSRFFFFLFCFFVFVVVFFSLFALLLFLFTFSFVCLLGEVGFVWPIGVTRFVLSLRGVVYF